jgi:methenyltetrahydromethanopterin cyclohydrolase
MLENRSEEGLVVRAEPLDRAEEVSHRMVEVERLKDGALLLDVDPSWAGAINAVLVAKGVRVSELLAISSRYGDMPSLTRGGD